MTSAPFFSAHRLYARLLRTSNWFHWLNNYLAASVSGRISWIEGSVCCKCIHTNPQSHCSAVAVSLASTEPYPAEPETSGFGSFGSRACASSSFSPSHVACCSHDGYPASGTSRLHCCVSHPLGGNHFEIELLYESQITSKLPHWLRGLPQALQSVVAVADCRPYG